MFRCEETVTLDRESSVGQSGQTGVSDGPGEANSDSGDSLFITQKFVPEAVRSGRRRRPIPRPGSITQEDPAAERQDDSFNSTSDEEPEENTKRRKRVHTLPKYRFFFLTENKMKPAINAAQNKALHVYAMGGYIRSVKELWESFEHGRDLEASLPTVDVDGESISPISEEEETTEDEDIKVVERKQFAISLKAKCSQPWYSVKTASGDKRPSNALNESQAGRRRTIRKVSKMTPLLKERLSSSETSDDEGSLCKSINTQGSNGSALQQTETPKTIRQFQKGKEIQLNDDRDAAICEQSPEKRIQIDREAAVAATEPNREVSHVEEPRQSGDTECGHENRKKKKKKYKGDRETVQEGNEQSHNKAGGQHDSVIITEEESPRLLEDINTPDLKRKKKKKSGGEDVTQEQSSEQVEEDSVGHSAVETVRKDKKKKKKRNHVDTESIRTTTAAEPLTDEGNMPKKRELAGTSDVPQTSTEHQQEMEEYSENMEASQETLGSSFKKQKKKKKKESATDDNSQTGQDDCIDEDVSIDAVTMETNTDLKVKKKKKRRISETVLTHTAEEDENTDGTQKTKHDSSITICEHTVALVDHSMSAQKKKKKRTSLFHAADEEEKASKTHEGQADHWQSAAPPDVSVGALAATSANVTESLQQTNGWVKKKKRKRISEQECVERELESEEPKETSEAEVKKKKKRKRNEAESSADVEVTQTDEDGTLKKRERKEKHRVPQAATEDAESTISKCNTANLVSPKLDTKKSKYVHNTETPHNWRLSNDQETRETLSEHVLPSSGQPGNQAQGGVEEKQTKNKRKIGLQEVESSTEVAELKAHKSKEKNRTKAVTDSSFSSATCETFLSNPEKSPSHGAGQKTKKHAKRRLYNQNEDFFLLN